MPPPPPPPTALLSPVGPLGVLLACTALAAAACLAGWLPLGADESQLQHQWYEEALPWRAVTPVAEVWAKQPTLLACEAVFVLGALLALGHAAAHGRRHLLVWVTAVVGGTANDVFFMVLPFCDNFFHAQCTVMLTPRLPLYIPCAYIVFMYVGVVAAWRLGLPAVPEAAATGLACAVFYAAFDITGAKHLWWTWHDTDAGVRRRWLGVPIGSTLWTLVHCFCFQLLLRRLALRLPRLGALAALGTTLWTALLTTPLMMLCMSVLQLHQLRIELPAGRVAQMPGEPDAPTLLLAVVAAGVLLWRGLHHPGRALAPWLQPRLAADRLLLAGVVAYFGVLLAVMALASPEDVVARGVHQPINPCGVVGHDLSNRSRFEFLCPGDYDEDFGFDCLPGGRVEAAAIAPRTTWYTVCGRAHASRATYTLAVALLAAVGSAGFAVLLTGSATPRQHKAKGL